jgi:hypothetical protein
MPLWRVSEARTGEVATFNFFTQLLTLLASLVTEAQSFSANTQDPAVNELSWVYLHRTEMVEPPMEVGQGVLKGTRVCVANVLLSEVPLWSPILETEKAAGCL